MGKQFLRFRIASCQKEINRLNNDITEYNSEINECSSVVSRLTTEQIKFAGYISDQTARKNRIASYCATCNLAGIISDGMTDKLRTTPGEIDNGFDYLIARGNNEITRLNGEISACNSTIASLNSTISSLQAQIDAIEQEEADEEST